MPGGNERDKFSKHLDSLRKVYHQDTNAIYLDDNYPDNYQKTKTTIDKVYNFYL